MSADPWVMVATVAATEGAIVAVFWFWCLSLSMPVKSDNRMVLLADCAVLSLAFLSLSLSDARWLYFASYFWEAMAFFNLSLLITLLFLMLMGGPWQRRWKRLSEKGKALLAKLKEKIKRSEPPPLPQPA